MMAWDEESEIEFVEFALEPCGPAVVRVHWTEFWGVTALDVCLFHAAEIRLAVPSDWFP